MILSFYLLLPLWFLSGDASSIRSRNNKNELVPFKSSELGSPGKGGKWWMVDDEPLLLKLRAPTPSDVKQTKERDKKRKRPTKKRVFKTKHLRKRHRTRRDVFAAKSKPIRREKSNTAETPQSDVSDHVLKNFTKNTVNRVDILKALSSFPKETEKGHFKDEQGDGTQRGKHGSESNRNHSKLRHSPSDQPLHVKMIYPATPKPDRHPHKYTYKDLIADRKRLEQKINYIKNMLSTNDSTADDPVRIRRRSESDKTANKIAKMFLTLSAVNGLHEKRRSRCKYGEEEEEDRVQDVWEKERKSSPSRKASSSNEERYKVKKWIEFMKNKRSSGKTCPCMANFREDSDAFPLEQKLPKDYFLMERSRSSEESSETYGDPYYSRDKLTGQHKRRNKGQEDLDKSKVKNGKKKLELPLNDLELYRSRAKQILQNAEEILDKIRDEEERRLSAPNILMNHLKELTSRIQSDPRNNENDLIRKIQKNLGWLPKSKENSEGNGFVDNVKSYILDPYEKAKELTDESAKMLSSYLLRNLGKMEESSEERPTDKDDRDNKQVYFGKVQPKEDDKPLAASLAKETDRLSKSKEELQNWEETISTIVNGAEEAVKPEPDLAKNREIFQNRMEDIIKEQQKKLMDYEISHQNSEETDDRTANHQQEEVKSANLENPEDNVEQTAKQEEVKSTNSENPTDTEDKEDEQTAKQQEVVMSAHSENPNDKSEDEQTEEQQEEVKSVNPESEKLLTKLGPTEKSDQETDKIENPLTGDHLKTQETLEGEEKPKKSSGPPKKQFSRGKQSENNDLQEEQIGEEILEEIIKTLDENEDPVGNEQEIKDSQENPETVAREEENEEGDRVAESHSDKSSDDYELLEETPKAEGNLKESSKEQTETFLQNQNPSEITEESDLEDKSAEDKKVLKESSNEQTETFLQNQNPSEKTEESDLGDKSAEEKLEEANEEDRVAESDSDDTSGLVFIGDMPPDAHNYKRLHETPKTEEDLKESSNEQTETFLQNQNPPEMTEESDLGDKSAEDNPEMLNQDDKEIVNLENNQDSSVEETQTDHEEVAQENPEILENAKPNEDEDAKRQDDEEEQTDDETRILNKQDADNLRIVESESVLDNEDNEAVESTLKNEEDSESLGAENEGRETDDDDTPLQAKSLEEEESLEDNDETPLREALESQEVQMAENGDDDPSDKNEETYLEMGKDEAVLKEAMNEDDPENEETKTDDEVQGTLNEAPREDEEELDEDNEIALQESNPQDAQNSKESLERARDEGNLDEVDEKSLKLNNPDTNPEEQTSEALNSENETNPDETLLEVANPKENQEEEDLNPNVETALEDQTEEDVQETPLVRENKTEENSAEKNSEETLKATLEDQNQDNLTDDEVTLKSENQEVSNEDEENLREALDEEKQENLDENRQDDETPLRTTWNKMEDNQDEGEAILEKVNSVENFDKVEGNPEDVDDDVGEAAPKESKNESQEMEEVVKTEQREEPEEDPESTNLQSMEGAVDPASSEDPDITDSQNQLYPENEDETPLKSAKPDETESEETLEAKSNETSREENLGENLILEENDESPLRDTDSEESLLAYPYQLQKPGKIKVPKSIGQIMKDLDEKDDLTSIQNLNPDKIDHIIGKIDEAEQQNLLEDPVVDCRKECACADEINTKSRNIGRYEIAKDFLHWMKDLQLNRVLGDD